MISNNQTTNLSTESASLLRTESRSNNSTLRPKKQLKANFNKFITCRTANRGQNNPKNQDYFAWKKLPFVLSNLHYIFLIFIRFLWKSPDSAGSVILHEEVQQPLLVIIIKLFQFFCCTIVVLLIVQFIRKTEISGFVHFSSYHMINQAWHLSALLFAYVESYIVWILTRKIQKLILHAYTFLVL